MLSALKFCAGSVAKKEIVAGLTHFKIEGGKVRGYNGTLALCSPIAFDITCKPKATDLIKAIGNCTDTVQLSLTKAGRLTVKSGVFKAHIDCIEQDTPHVEPEGDIVQFDGQAMLDAIKIVAPFIGEDASRQWAQGILFKDKSLFATNNIILVQYYTAVTFPVPINLPRAAIKEMLRINEAPLFAQVASNSITFHYSEDRWLRTQMYPTDWPDIARILSIKGDMQPMAQDLFEGLDVIRPFTDKMGSVWFDGSGNISTHELESEGASYNVPELQWEGRYNIDMLSLLKGSADFIDWSQWPGACPFRGANNKMRGVIIGMKK